MYIIRVCARILLLPLARSIFSRPWEYLKNTGSGIKDYFDMEAARNKVTGDIYNTSLYANTFGRLSGQAPRSVAPEPAVPVAPSLSYPSVPYGGYGGYFGSRI